MALSNTARKKLNKFENSMRRGYGVENLEQKFEATPAVEQRLVDEETESDEFLNAINTPLVEDIKGENIEISSGNTITKRTNTKERERKPQRVNSLNGTGYELAKTEHDVAISYEMIDRWSRFDNFHERMLNAMRFDLRLSRIKVAWNGTHAADETDPEVNLLGEDVNRGFIQILREFEGGHRTLSEVGTSGKIRIGGPNADFMTVDELVYATQMLIPDHLQGGLVSLMGNDLQSYSRAKIIKATAEKPTEKSKVEEPSVYRKFGTINLAPQTFHSYFPRRGLLITSISNLSLYIQEGSIRQQAFDDPKNDQYCYYYSDNEGYTYENAKKAAMIEPNNLEFWDEVTETYV